jgi:hypothetical protein
MLQAQVCSKGRPRNIYGTQGNPEIWYFCENISEISHDGYWRYRNIGDVKWNRKWEKLVSYDHVERALRAAVWLVRRLQMKVTVSKGTG